MTRCQGMSGKLQEVSGHCPKNLRRQIFDMFGTFVPIWSLLLPGDPVQRMTVTRQEHCNCAWLEITNRKHQMILRMKVPFCWGPLQNPRSSRIDNLKETGSAIHNRRLVAAATLTGSMVDGTTETGFALLPLRQTLRDSMLVISSLRTMDSKSLSFPCWAVVCN